MLGVIGSRMALVVRPAFRASHESGGVGQGKRKIQRLYSRGSTISCMVGSLPAAFEQSEGGGAKFVLCSCDGSWILLTPLVEENDVALGKGSTSLF